LGFGFKASPGKEYSKVVAMSSRRVVYWQQPRGAHLLDISEGHLRGWSSSGINNFCRKGGEREKLDARALKKK